MFERKSLPSPRSLTKDRKTQNLDEGSEDVLQFTPYRFSPPQNHFASKKYSFRRSNSIDEFVHPLQSHYDLQKFKSMTDLDQPQPEPLSIRRIRFDSKVKQQSNPLKQPTQFNVPFADGIDLGKSNCPTYDLPSNIALKLDWPLDVEGFNQDRKIAQQEKKSKAENQPSEGGPTLVYYRKYLELKRDELELEITTVKLVNGEGIQAGKVLFRAECDQPCWTTNSRRYESPIRIGIGRSGPIVWEIWPIASKSKSNRKQKFSSWSILNTLSQTQLRIHGEDLECLRYSIVDEQGDEFWLYAQTESKIKLATDGEKVDVAYFDPWDDWGSLHLNTRPSKSIHRKRERDPIEIAFIIAMFEASLAIRDENFGAGKRRRDDRGRLLIPKMTAIAKAFSRILDT